MPPEPPVAPRRRPRHTLLGAIGILVVAIVAAAAGAGLVAASADDAAPVVIRRAASAQAPQTPVSPPPGAGLDAAAIGAAVIPSVVTVEVGTLQAGTFVPNATGSGVVIDDRGNIATNDHVVGGASAVRVIFSNGTVYEAEMPIHEETVAISEALGIDPLKLLSSGSLLLCVDPDMSKAVIEGLKKINVNANVIGKVTEGPCIIIDGNGVERAAGEVLQDELFRILESQ